MAVDRQTVDLSAYPDLVVIYLGMPVRPILLENLLDKASASASLDVKFRVVKPGPPPIPPEWQSYIDSQWDKFLAANPGVTRVDTAAGIRGDLLTGEPKFPGDEVLELGRKDFLNHGIVTYQDSDYTVESVLRVAANSLGGIHHDDGAPNRNKRAEELRNYSNGSTMMGRSMLAWYVFQIALCTLRACRPLANKLADLGMYSAAPSEWVWSADGKRTVTPGQNPATASQTSTVGTDADESPTPGWR
jgi:hypothetical protein